MTEKFFGMTGSCLTVQWLQMRKKKKCQAMTKTAENTTKVLFLFRGSDTNRVRQHKMTNESNNWAQSKSKKKRKRE